MTDTSMQVSASGTPQGPSPNGNSGPGAFSEIGLTGLKRPRTRGMVEEEFLRELVGTRGIRVLKEMRDNDSVVGAILFAIDKLLRRVEWRVEQEEADEKDALFVEECMNDMSHTWADFISECLSMLVFGWSYFEEVYKKRQGPVGPRNKVPSSKHSDGKIGWRKFAIRAQETLDGWEWDEAGGVQGLWQSAPPDEAKVFIPIEKSLLFRTQSVKGNPEGRSFLRNAYRPWYYKKRFEEIEAIGIERDLVGFPVMRVDPRILDPNAPPEYKALAAAYSDVIVNIRRDQQEGLLLPNLYDDKGNRLYELELLSSGGSRQFDTNAIIGRWDQRIAMTVLADFILLGHERVGSFALSSDKTDLFSVALGAMLDAIKSVLNDYALPRLWALNGMNLERMPTIVYGDIEDAPLAEVAGFLMSLSGAGMTVFPNVELEDHLMEMAGLPKKTEDQRDTEQLASMGWTSEEAEPEPEEPSATGNEAETDEEAAATELPA